MKIFRFRDSEDSQAELVVVVTKENVTQTEINDVEDCIANSFDNSDIDGFAPRIIDAMDRVFGEKNYEIPEISEEVCV